MKRLLAWVLFILLMPACTNNTSDGDNDTEIVNTINPPASISYNIVGVYPHDTASFTQGLVWINDTLYEGTGLEGESRLMVVDFLYLATLIFLEISHGCRACVSFTIRLLCSLCCS